MNRLAAPIAALVMLAGCNPEQLAAAQRYHENIAYVCNQAVAILPMFPQLEPWLSACRTASGIARLAMDGSSLQWLGGIMSKL